MLQQFTYIFLFFLFFSCKARSACKDKIVPRITLRRLTLREVRLCAVLVTIGSSENLIVFSQQCQPILDFQKKSKFQNIIIWNLISLDMKILENQKHWFDSKQCQPILDFQTFQFPSLRSVSLSRVDSAQDNTAVRMSGGVCTCSLNN